MTQTAAPSGMCKNFATIIVNRLTIRRDSRRVFMGLEGLGDLKRPRCFKSRDAFQQRLLVCCCFSGMHGPAPQDRARIVLDCRIRMVRSQSTRKAQMKTILMLVVGLMLAGCGSMENHVGNHGVASTSDPASYDLGNRIAVDTICACP
jgi:hypothetical protein